MPSSILRIYSWNVNGLRAIAKKGFLEWLGRAHADVVGLQETRVHPDDLGSELLRPKRLLASFTAAKRRGYSGVGLLSREAPDAIDTELGDPAFDVEGRLQIAQFGALTIVNGYFPNGNGKNRDNGRVPYKLAFYRALFNRLDADRRAGRPIVVMGDLNTAHREIDLARPKQNAKTSGFLEEEREELDRWFRSGWVDTFRAFETGAGHYTWWSQRFGVRARNVGWRIDYVLASEGAMPHLRGARIHPDVVGSDHCPISVELDRRILGG
jgi:exodeoxyribonuclease-3